MFIILELCPLYTDLHGQCHYFVFYPMSGNVCVRFDDSYLCLACSFTIKDHNIYYVSTSILENIVITTVSYVIKILLCKCCGSSYKNNIRRLTTHIIDTKGPVLGALGTGITRYIWLLSTNIATANKIIVNNSIILKHREVITYAGP